MDMLSSIAFILKNSYDLDFYAFSTFLMMTCCLSYVLLKYPKVPWHFIFFVLTLGVGYLAAGQTALPTVGQFWENKSSMTEDMSAFTENMIYSFYHLGEIDYLFKPTYILNLFG